jgi:hypothetical protein
MFWYCSVKAHVRYFSLSEKSTATVRFVDKAAMFAFEHV